MVTASEKARFLWQCRRGMLELDVILNRFVNTGLDALSASEVASFDKLLSTPDPVLYAWLMGFDEPDEKELASLVATIKGAD